MLTLIPRMPLEEFEQLVDEARVEAGNPAFKVRIPSAHWLRALN